ncbi:UPF0262 family protein [Magnetospirillum molischianum]|uniref:UPF0262 protein PHAMO_210033 n=1 Tax=Magnetospirillum molischianum DSM 120 TaxID=1150626 RepID=H8FQ84_MAGML|nr:UPF0262 family protein [Magnetospirillum molischianum]CCG40522.1 conserved hypothetical protein [Magnetospirillum molischianum DSM 120]
MPERQRLIDIRLDDKTLVRRSAEVEHERAVAIYDLIEENSFIPEGGFVGPYLLRLRLEDNRLIFDIRSGEDVPLTEVGLTLTAFQSLVKDYFLVCESYYTAIRTAPPSRIEALDQGRRALHDEGATLLLQRLTGRIRLDFVTARRLFTLICILHVRG